MGIVRIVMFGQKKTPSRQGGVEVVVEQLSCRMAARGHDVTCYVRGGRRKTKYKGVTVRSTWRVPWKGLSAVSSSFCAAVCAAFSPADVVHIHAEGPAFFCWIPKLLGKPVVVTVHGLDWKREKWKGSFGASYILAGEKMAVRYADKMIVLSQSMQTYFRSRYGRETVLIPNGTDRHEGIPAFGIQRQWKLEKDGYLLFVGRLVPEKGLHTLIQAFQQVKTEKNLVIAGASSDTDAYAAKLKSMAARDDRILFTGFVQGDVLGELYSNAYLYVLPTALEGMPLSLLEAMSYGNCCLVSDIPECLEIIGDCGFAFPVGEKTALRDAMQWLCNAPQNVAACRGRVSRAVCSDWDSITERTLAVYAGLADQ